MFTDIPAYVRYYFVPWRKLFLGEQKQQQTELDLKPETEHVQHIWNDFATSNLTLFETDYIGKILKAGTANHCAVVSTYFLFLIKGTVTGLLSVREIRVPLPCYAFHAWMATRTV